MRYATTVGMISVALLMTSCASAPKPEPCNCDKAQAELTRYTELYLNALEDVGNLRQQVKALQERTP